MKLEELVDVAGTANWRRQKLDEYPDDSRNLEAANLLDALAKDLPALEGSDVHRQIERAYDGDGTSEVSEVVSEVLRSVGFHAWPNSGRELLEVITSRLEA
jgi:hypothetical protein